MTSNSKYIAYSRNQIDRASKEELFDILDTCNSGNAENWEMVAQKVRRSYAERILRAVNGERFEEGDLR